MFALKAFLMAILPFYKMDFPVRPVSTDWSYTRYVEGKVVEELKIAPKSSMQKELQMMLSTQSKGWKYDISTYAPDHLYVSTSIRVNCVKGALVVNYISSGGDDMQISKDLPLLKCPEPGAK